MAVDLPPLRFDHPFHGQLMSWAILFAFLLSSCAAIGQGADVRRAPTEIIIYNDQGGKLGDYFQDVLAAYKTIKRVRIEGKCVSACTAWLYLGDRVCVGPQAKLGFHKAEYPDGSVSEAGTQSLVMLFYPAWAQEWFKANVPGTEIVWMQDSVIRSNLKQC